MIHDGLQWSMPHGGHGQVGLSRWNNLKSPGNIWASYRHHPAPLFLISSCSGDAGPSQIHWPNLATVCHSVSSAEVLTHVRHTPSPCKRAAWYSPAPGSVASCATWGGSRPGDLQQGTTSRHCTTLGWLSSRSSEISRMEET